jgi:hypothetical protein
MNRDKTAPKRAVRMNRHRHWFIAGVTIAVAQGISALILWKYESAPETLKEFLYLILVLPGGIVAFLFNPMPHGDESALWIGIVLNWLLLTVVLARVIRPGPKHLSNNK